MSYPIFLHIDIHHLDSLIHLISPRISRFLVFPCNWILYYTSERNPLVQQLSWTGRRMKNGSIVQHPSFLWELWPALPGFLCPIHGRSCLGFLWQTPVRLGAMPMQRSNLDDLLLWLWSENMENVIPVFKYRYKNHRLKLRSR